MCPAIPISSIYGGGIENWNASAYAALSAASHLSAIVRQQTALFSVTKAAWKLDRVLRRFLEEIYKAVEDPPPLLEPVTTEQIMDAANICRKLSDAVEQLYLRAKSKGLTNRALVGPVLNSLKVRGDEILELAEALELSLNSGVDARLERAREDLRNGMVYDLPALK